MPDDRHVRAEAARCIEVVRIYTTATGEVHALKGIDTVIPTGAVTAIVGPSGSGKSTLLRLLAGLDRPTAGQVLLSGNDLSGRSGRQLRRLRRDLVGYVFQRPSDNLLTYLTAEQHLHHAAAVRGTRVDAHGLLERVGLRHRAHHRPRELSGGEQQRLALAQAVVGDPTLLIADEPTAELDSASGERVLALLRELADTGRGVVLSTHDDLAVQASDLTLFLRHGALEAERVTGAEALAVIDGAGRIQLPPEALARFADRRAVIELHGDEVRLRPPGVVAREQHGRPGGRDDDR